MVRGWKVEASDASCPPTVRESKEDALRIAHARARGTLNDIVVLDEQGRVESRYPYAPSDIDGA